MNIIDPEEEDTSSPRKGPEWVINYERRKSESSIPVVTQMTQEDTQDSTYASNSINQFVSPTPKKKNISSKLKLPISSSRSSCWTSRLPKGLKMKGVFKVKKKRTNTISKVQIGSIVQKKLRVFQMSGNSNTISYSSKNFFQKAIVLGTVKDRLKKGRWLIHFDNEMKLNLRCDEFTVVAYNPKQTVIARDNNNNMSIRSSTDNFFNELNAEKFGLTQEVEDTNESETTDM